MTKKVKLTIKEFKKAVEAGMQASLPCACIGVQEGDEFCPCENSILDMLNPAGQKELAAEWRKSKAERLAAMQAEEARRPIPFPDDNAKPKNTWSYDPNEAW